MNFENKIDMFKEELNLIIKEPVREFIKSCLRMAPDYVFEDCPSSATGKYHPVDELAGDGTVIHTKRCFTIAYELSRGLACEDRRDEVCGAAILHDMVKQGLTKSGFTTKDHPQLMAEIITEIYNASFKETLAFDSYDIIRAAVFYHYGPWTLEKYRKPLAQYTMPELCLYLADYVSSKRVVDVKYQRKEGFGI